MHSIVTRNSSQIFRPDYYGFLHTGYHTVIHAAKANPTTATLPVLNFPPALHTPPCGHSFSSVSGTSGSLGPSPCSSSEISASTFSTKEPMTFPGGLYSQTTNQPGAFPSSSPLHWARPQPRVVVDFHTSWVKWPVSWLKHCH